jgi:hypothetical protein
MTAVQLEVLAQLQTIAWEISWENAEPPQRRGLRWGDFTNQIVDDQTEAVGGNR